MAAVCNTALLEIGRKIRVPGDEETGVATYSALWGRRGATLAWLSSFALLTLSGGAAAHAAGLAMAFVLLIAPVTVVATLCGLRYLRNPEAAKALEPTSALATLALYAALGPAALLGV